LIRMPSNPPAIRAKARCRKPEAVGEGAPLWLSRAKVNRMGGQKPALQPEQYSSFVHCSAMNARLGFAAAAPIIR
jgi:hypothetical protein